MAVNNTVTYSQSYDAALQDRLDRPTTWKEMCLVRITDDRAWNSNYISTEPVDQAVTRGTASTAQTFVETQESGTISTGRDLGLIVDLADLAQSPWTRPMELFDRIGAILNERIETAILARHASWTDFGTADIGGGGTSTSVITVSAANVDDIIRGVKREVSEANGQFLWNQYGLGFVWRAADFEYLEAFAQANGFATADEALKEGTVEGLHYLGVDHYWSNNHAANHLFAGVKKVEELGILRSLYGKAFEIPFPGADDNTAGRSFFSGTAFYSRIDYGHLTRSGHSTLVFDINVA